MTNSNLIDIVRAALAQGRQIPLSDLPLATVEAETEWNRLGQVGFIEVDGQRVSLRLMSNPTGPGSSRWRASVPRAPRFATPALTFGSKAEADDFL